MGFLYKVGNSFPQCGDSVGRISWGLLTGETKKEGDEDGKVFHSFLVGFRGVIFLSIPLTCNPMRF